MSSIRCTKTPANYRLGKHWLAELNLAAPIISVQPKPNLADLSLVEVIFVKPSIALPNLAEGILVIPIRAQPNIAEPSRF